MNSNTARQELPFIGRTRCYWCFLSPELRFLYLDPVFNSHLEEQGPALLGHSLLDFLHPDEVESAKADLGNVVKSRVLHGSVTRVRFSRLSRVRQLLGYQGPPASPPSFDRLAHDENYVVLDIVVNWATDTGMQNTVPGNDDGLVLCFLHIQADMNPPQDNDESVKSDWSNWCGSPSFSMHDLEDLNARLLPTYVDKPLDAFPTRVFQLLAQSPGKELIVSFPPSSNEAPPSPRIHSATPDVHATLSLSSKLASLVHAADISGGNGSKKDARTNCTRRFRAVRPITVPYAESDHQDVKQVAVEVESLFIPYGSVIFACFKVNLPETSQGAGAERSQIQDTVNHPGLVTSRLSAAPVQSHPPSFSDHDLDPALYSVTSHSTPGDRPSISPPPSKGQQEPHYNHMSTSIVSANAALHSQTSSASASTTGYPSSNLYSYDAQHPSASYHDDSNPSLPPLSASMSAHHAQNPSYYMHPPPPQYGSSTQYATRPYDYHQQPQWQSNSSHVQATPRSAQASTYLVGPGEYPQPGSPDLYYSRHDISSVTDTVPSAAEPVSDYASPGSRSQRGSDGRQSPEVPVSSSSKPKSASNRPAGVQQCSSCKATSSPEWRKGPSGKKELCNACGLRFARSRAKREGTAGQRKAQAHLQRQQQQQAQQTPGTIQFSHHNPHEAPRPAAKRRKHSPRDLSPGLLSKGQTGSVSPNGYSYATPPPSSAYSNGSNHSPGAGSNYSAGSGGFTYPNPPSYAGGTPPPAQAGSKRGFSAYEAGSYDYEYESRYEDPVKRTLAHGSSSIPSPPSHSYQPYPSSSGHTRWPSQSSKSGRGQSGPSPLSAGLTQQASNAASEVDVAGTLRDLGNGVFDDGRPVSLSRASNDRGKDDRNVASSSRR